MSDSKGVRAALKEARERIDAKDFKSALKCCKRALNVDSSHYLALVFSGLCQAEAGQYAQAAESYTKAVGKDPSQLVGWQGLASFYEKHSSKMGDEGRRERAEDLMRAYERMAELQAPANEDKSFETTNKLWKLALDGGNLDRAVSVLVGQLRRAEQSTQGTEEARRRRRREARANLVAVLGKQEQLSDEHSQLLVDVLQAALVEAGGDQSIQSMENSKTLIKLLYRLRRMEELLSTAVRMGTIFSSHTYPLEWICKVYLEWATGTLHFSSDELRDDGIRHHVDRLLELSPKSSLGLLSRGVLAWREGKLQESSATLREALETSQSTNFYGSYALCRCLFELGELSQAEEAVEACQHLMEAKVKEKETRVAVGASLASMLVRCLYRQGKLKRTREVLSSTTFEGEKEDEELNLIRLKVKAAFYSSSDDGQVGDLREQIDKLSKSAPAHEVGVVRAMLANSLGDAEAAKGHLREALAAKSDCFEALLLLGRIELDSEKGEEMALPFLLRAAKKDPHSPAPFLWLGKLYFRRWKALGSEGDLDKARKCLQKSFSLAGGRTDAEEAEEAGAALSDIYRAQKADESNLKFLVSVTKQSTASSGKATWAFLRLGILYLDQDDSTNAILSLQSALRGDPESVTGWECLADAYKARGSYTAAIKAFEKVLKLNPDSAYGELQLGSLRLLLGHLDEAADLFRRVLHRCDSRWSALLVPTLKGLSEALLCLAREALDEYVDDKAVRCCEEAVRLLVRAATVDPAVACLWKLMGEACTIIRDLPEETVEGIMIPECLVTSDAPRESSLPCDKRQVLEVGSRCFLRAARCSHESAAACRDLAVSYHARAGLKGEAGKKDALVEKAFAAARKSVCLDPQSSEGWNLLGYLAIHWNRFALAQHALVRSVMLENNARAWANLGILYLLAGNPDLANRSFNESQKADPSSLPGWVGQAMLAQQQQDCDEEAMDLFRHTTFLGNDVESGLGYATWVCRTLKAMSSSASASPKPHNRYCIERMHGVTVAVDCLERCNRRVQGNAASLNLLGILLEREGLLRCARRTLRRCLDLLPCGGAATGATRRNLARVCLKLGDHPSAVHHAAAVEEPDLECMAVLAAAHHGAGAYRESYAAYQACLSVAPDDKKAHFLAAMAAIAYRFQGPAAAKTLLFQSCQLSPPSVPGLFALCVLGLKQRDTALVDAALHELRHFADDPRYLADVASLRALSLLASGSAASARRHMGRQAHRFPQVGAVWAALAAHLVEQAKGDEVDPGLLAASARLAERAAGLSRMELGSSKDGGWRGARQVREDMNLVTSSLALAYRENPSETRRRRLLRAGARAVHLSPDDGAGWTMLAAGALSDPLRPLPRSRAAFVLDRVEAIVEGAGEADALKEYMGQLRSLVQ